MQQGTWGGRDLRGVVGGMGVFFSPHGEEERHFFSRVFNENTPFHILSYTHIIYLWIRTFTYVRTYIYNSGKVRM